MPGSAQLSSMSKPLHLRLPLPVTLSQVPPNCQTQGPTHDCLTVRDPGTWMWERKQASGAQGFSVWWAEGGGGSACFR